MVDTDDAVRVVTAAGDKLWWKGNCGFAIAVVDMFEGVRHRVLPVVVLFVADEILLTDVRGNNFLVQQGLAGAGMRCCSVREVQCCRVQAAVAALTLVGLLEQVVAWVLMRKRKTGRGISVHKCLRWLT